MPDRACFRFVDGLEQAAASIGRLVTGAPTRAATLYETFLAGCYEKAEEVGDSSGSFGTFVQTLICGWITARQAAGACPQQTATLLLTWMDTDQYGFCNQLERQAATALHEAGLAALTNQIQARFDAAAQATAASDASDRTNQYARRRWAEALRTLHATRNDLDAYLALAQQTGLTAEDCLTLANMLTTQGNPTQALSWVERGLVLDAQASYGSFAGHSLAEAPVRSQHKRFGDVAAVWSVLDGLDVVGLVDDVVPRHAHAGASVGTYLALATLNRVVEPRSKRAFADWWVVS